MSIPGGQPITTGTDGQSRVGVLTRRVFLLASASVAIAIAPWLRSAAQETAAAAFGLDEFMRLSRVLTGFDDLSDGSLGREYLDALRARPGGVQLLAECWRLGGFDGPSPPAAVADLEARRLYERPELSELLDSITVSWYSGTYFTIEGEQRVATYTDALAWRALGYRPSGPGTCGGAFGHWSERPA